MQGLLQAHIRIFGCSDLEFRQWRQLVVACNVFAQKCVDGEKFGIALELLQKAEVKELKIEYIHFDISCFIISG